jgi:hypothetical protein
MASASVGLGILRLRMISALRRGDHSSLRMTVLRKLTNTLSLPGAEQAAHIEQLG